MLGEEERKLPLDEERTWLMGEEERLLLGKERRWMLDEERRLLLGEEYGCWVKKIIAG